MFIYSFVHIQFQASWILLLLGFLFVPVYLRSKIFTMPEYLKKRFQSKYMRAYMTVVSLVSYVTTKISVSLWNILVLLIFTIINHWFKFFCSNNNCLQPQKGVLLEISWAKFVWFSRLICMLVAFLWEKLWAGTFIFHQELSLPSLPSILYSVGIMLLCCTIIITFLLLSIFIFSVLY